MYAFEYCKRYINSVGSLERRCILAAIMHRASERVASASGKELAIIGSELETDFKRVWLQEAEKQYERQYQQFVETYTANGFLQRYAMETVKQAVNLQRQTSSVSMMVLDEQQQTSGSSATIYKDVDQHAKLKSRYVVSDTDDEDEEDLEQYSFKRQNTTSDVRMNTVTEIATPVASIQPNAQTEKRNESTSSCTARMEQEQCTSDGREKLTSDSYDSDEVVWKKKKHQVQSVVTVTRTEPFPESVDSAQYEEEMVTTDMHTYWISSVQLGKRLAHLDAYDPNEISTWMVQDDEQEQYFNLAGIDYIILGVRKKVKNYPTGARALLVRMSVDNCKSRDVRLKLRKVFKTQCSQRHVSPYFEIREVRPLPHVEKWTHEDKEAIASEMYEMATQDNVDELMQFVE